MTKASTRRHLALAGAVVACTGILAGTVPAQAASATPATSAGRHHQGRGTQGFTVARTAAAPVITMASPAPGELWVAEKAADGQVLLEHLRGGRWSTQRLAAPAGATAVSGTARDDVWLTTEGTLWHYDGRRWSRVGLPAGATATTVADAPGADAYVGLTGEGTTTGVYRVNGARWTSLGAPVDDNTGRHYAPADLAVADGRVYGNWNAPTPSNGRWQHAFAYEQGQWRHRFQTFETGHGAYNRLGAWLVLSRDVQLSLGAGGVGGPLPTRPMCATWTKSAGETNCTTRWAVGGAAQRKDGRVVIGGNDFQSYGQPVQQGTFGLRDAGGTERVVPGDPGDATLAVAVERGTNTAWAATRTGNVTRLQTWAG